MPNDRLEGRREGVSQRTSIETISQFVDLDTVRICVDEYFRVDHCLGFKMYSNVRWHAYQ